MISDFTAVQWTAVLIAAFLVGFSKTGVVGLGILIVPLLASVFEAKQSVGALLPMLVFGDLFAVAYYRRHAQWGLLLKLLPWVMPGIVAGYFILQPLEDAQLKPVLGGLVLVILLAKVALDRNKTWIEEHVPHRWWFSAIMGFLAGVATTVGNVAGPIMSVYLLSMGLQKREFMGTGAWYYLIVNTIKGPVFWHLGMITPATLGFNLWMLPLIAGGAGVGILVFHRIPQAWFDRVVLGLAALAALKLLLT